MSVDVARLLVRYSASLGIGSRRSPALRALESASSGADERIPAGTFAAALDELARASGDACLGLHLGAWSWQFPGSHIALAVAANSSTVGEALERLLRFHALLVDAVAPTLARKGEDFVVRLGTPRDVPIARHVADMMAATLVGIVRRLSDSTRVLEVTLRHDPPRTSGEHERVLGSPVRFGASEDALRIEAASLSAPVLLADRELLGMLERRASRRMALLDEPGFSGRVRRATEKALLTSGALPTLSAVARSLATSSRTLQVRLRSEATSFRRASEEARRSIAEELLAERDLTLAEVAFMLGFADQSAFTHAFRRWTGKTPGSFRRRPPACAPRR